MLSLTLVGSSGGGRATIQVAFAILVLTETWLVPFEGYLIEKFGPRVMIGISGVPRCLWSAVNGSAVF